MLPEIDIEWKKVGAAIAPLFPAIGGALGGHGGGMLGALIASQLDGDPAERQQAVAELKANPQAFIEANPQILVKLADIEAQRQGVIVRDVAHARENVRDQTMQRRLAAYIVPMPLIFGAALMYFRPDPAILAILTTILGAMLSEARQVFSYYFGSALGSKQKQTQINQMIDQETTTGAFRRG